MRQSGAVVVGAGIAGVATCYDLAVRRGVEGVIVVDPRPPLSVTSDKSSECYRNFFPNRPMVELTNRSIDFLETMKEQSDDFFNFSRRGYLFVTGDPGQLASLTKAAEASSRFGAGQVRFVGDAGANDQQTGFDVYRTPEALLHRFPYLSDQALGALHVRRGGWFSAQQLGAWMLERARDRGAEVVVDEVVDVETLRGRVSGALLSSGARISTPAVVNAAGPMSGPVARLVGIELPLRASLHHKVSFRDHLGAFPREAPMLLWTDPVNIDWGEAERSALAAEGFDELLGEIATPVFGRPEGGADSPFFEALWNYRPDVRDEPIWPAPRPDFMFPEAVLRGMAAMLPSLARYRDQLPPLGCGRGVCHEDPGEPPPDRAGGSRGLLSGNRDVGIRGDDRGGRRRPGRRSPDRRRSPRVCRQVPARPLRGSGLPGDPRPGGHGGTGQAGSEALKTQRCVAERSRRPYRVLYTADLRTVVRARPK